MNIMEILGMLGSNSPVILANIVGGFVFAKFVYNNMMKISLQETAGNDAVYEEIETREGPGKIITVNQITHHDTIRPASQEALFFYKNIFRVITFKFCFFFGSMVFLLAVFLTMYLRSGRGGNYYVMIAYGIFTVFIIVLLFFYIKHLRGVTHISKNLVVLRVFGSKTNTQFLFNRIVHLWNYIGTSFTIMDPIYARSEFTIIRAPKNFKLKVAQIASFVPGAVFVYYLPFHNALLNYLFVIISSIVIFMVLLYLIAHSFFIKDTGSLLEKIHKDSNFSKTWYGMGKQINLYCFDNIWKKALREMLGKANIVIMDLRGYSRDRKGCSFEMSYLVNNFDLDKTLFLMNRNTDRNYVLESLQREADRMRSDSPNAGKEDLRCTVYSCEKQNRKDTQQITQILCNKLGGQPDSPPVMTEHSYKTRLPMVTIPSIIFIPVLFMIISQYVLLILFVTSYTVGSCYHQIQFAQNERFLVTEPPPPLANFPLPSFSVVTSDAEPHFASITVSLGYEDSGELTSELRSRSDQISHIVQLVLSTKKYADMATLEKKIELAEEIKKHINIVLISGKVKDVYFVHFTTN